MANKHIREATKMIRLIDANELLAIGHKTKLIEVFPEWKELPISAQKAVCKYGRFMKQMIQQLPTVDAVEVVHGRWNDGECTACGFDIRDLIDADSDFRNWVWDGLPYCPNCGAKMDGDGNG